MQYEPLFFDIETTGFNPLAEGWHNENKYDAQVTCIAYGVIDGWREASGHEDVDYSVHCVSNMNEWTLLRDFRENIESLVDGMQDVDHEPFMVTFNGRKFDHPYLGARYARLRQECAPVNHSHKRLDMMRALGKHLDSVRRYPSEDDCLEAVGIESDDEYDGSDMPGFFEDNNFAAIESHATSDVEEMMRLFVETREECMTEFDDHYDDVEAKTNFVEEWTP